MTNYLPQSDVQFEIVVEEHKFQNLFFAELYLDAFANTLRETFGAGMHNNFFELNGDYMHWVVDVASYEKMAKHFMQFLLKKPEFIRQANSNLFAAIINLNSFSQVLHSTSFSTKTNAELLAYYEKQRELTKETLRWGLFAPMIEVREPLYTDFLTQLLNNKNNSLTQKTSVAEAVAVLCTFEGETIAKKEQYELLQLAIKVKSIQNISKYETELKKHADQFGWLSYNYSGPGWNVEDYRKMLISILNENPQTKLKQLKESQRTIIEKRKFFEDKFNLTEKEKQFFAIARDFMKAKALRREALSFTGYAGETLCREIAKRFALSLLQVRLMTFKELTAMLNGHEVDLQEINARAKRLLFGFFEDGKQIVLVTGKNVDLFTSRIMQDEVDSALKQLTGKCACVGTAIGKVVIVNSSSDMAKMQKGDVLVSIATSPDLVPAMRLASAIITDSGGLTSHAAIVSREMHIPCVIGTKIATKLLKDGETVSVDATNGIVTRR